LSSKCNSQKDKPVAKDTNFGVITNFGNTDYLKNNKNDKKKNSLLHNNKVNRHIDESKIKSESRHLFALSDVTSMAPKYNNKFGSPGKSKKE